MGVLAIADTVDVDVVRRFVEQHAVISDAKADQARELAGERLDVPLARLCVAMQSLQNLQGCLLLDSAVLSRDVRMSANFLQAA